MGAWNFGDHVERLDVDGTPVRAAVFDEHRVRAALSTNTGIRGPSLLSICLACLTLMWLEAVLGLCRGCEIARPLVRRGWMRRDGVRDLQRRRLSRGRRAMKTGPWQPLDRWRRLAQEHARA